MVCIWRVRDEVCTTATLPSLVTALKWRTNEAEAESPLLVVSDPW